jgi:hypothetical protein
VTGNQVVPGGSSTGTSIKRRRSRPAPRNEIRPIELERRRRCDADAITKAEMDIAADASTSPIISLGLSFGPFQTIGSSRFIWRPAMESIGQLLTAGVDSLQISTMNLIGN